MRKQVDIVNQLEKAVSEESRHAGHASGVATASETVVDLVHTVMHRFRSLQHRVTRDGAHDVTHMESKVLGFFARHAGATLSDLAQHSGRDKAQLARLVKGLRERGLLTAKADALDKRNVHLTLSDLGQSMQDALRQEGRALSARALEGLSPGDQARLIALLEQVKANLEAVAQG
jgi:DNA-binding MarR family transcriptional regulator